MEDNAAMASHISYQVALVDFPLLSTEAWHLASTVQQETANDISASLTQAKTGSKQQTGLTHWL